MSENLQRLRSQKPVAIWLMIGVGMLVVQVLLGGITRLTGSGLSITEWEPIMGALPPMNDHDWQTAFDKYKEIAQYKYVNRHFTLSDFKFIFFWEWFHRLWARLIGVVFLIPFIVFIIQKRFTKEMIRPLVLLFLLGALQGLVGWIMVLSGLNDSDLVHVSHYRLAIHFILALVLLVYALWFTLRLTVPQQQIFVNNNLRKFLGWICALLVLQLIYGAFMAGLKAATAAPTWPDMNGAWLPPNVSSHAGRNFDGLSFLVDHPLVIHFIHRNLAYLLTVLILWWTWKAFKVSGSQYFRKTLRLPMYLVFVQVILGIFTVLYSPDQRTFLWLGVAHQFVAMMLLLSFTWMFYIIRGKNYVIPNQA